MITTKQTLVFLIILLFTFTAFSIFLKQVNIQAATWKILFSFFGFLCFFVLTSFCFYQMFLKKN